MQRPDQRFPTMHVHLAIIGGGAAANGQMSRIVRDGPGGSRRQQLDDLGLADGGEIAIPTSDGTERIRLFEAHHDVGAGTERLDDVRRCHGRCDDNLACTVGPGDLDGCGLSHRLRCHRRR